MGASTERRSPIASSRKKSTTLEYLLNVDSGNYVRSPSPKLHNNIRRKPKSCLENEEILSLICYCSFTFTFTDPRESPSQQDAKRLKLIQLLSIIRNVKSSLDGEVLSPFFSMLSANLFRRLPPTNNCSLICALPDDEDAASTPTPAWPHLQIAYDILLRLILNTDTGALRDHIDRPFLLNLLSLFQSEDSRERESVKNVYHKIYSKFTFHRSFMRKAMNDVFIHYVSETDEKHCGIGDLLEIWGSIINGFTIPLKEEHKLFLLRVLVPLHKAKGMQVYHRQLSYCVSQLVQKDPTLGGAVIRGILRYWPVTNCQKEILLIAEVEELVENTDVQQYPNIALPLCSQIAKCLNSWNSQVAERALYVWNNEHFWTMATQALEDVFPVVVECIEKNLKWHWSKSVRHLTENVKAMLQKSEPQLYSKCLEELENQESIVRQEDIRRKQSWERIEMAADMNSRYLQNHPHTSISVSN